MKTMELLKMDYDECLILPQKNIKLIKPINQPITKYESVWSMYSDKKINNAKI
jgi:hypothetical protein